MYNEEWNKKKTKWFELGWKVHIWQFTVDEFVCLHPIRTEFYEEAYNMNLWIHFLFVCIFVLFYLLHWCTQEFPSFFCQRYPPPSPRPIANSSIDLFTWHVRIFRECFKISTFSQFLSFNFSLLSILVIKFWNSSLQAGIHQL